VKDASLYLLDEPGNNLDPDADRAFLEAIQSLRSRATIVMITHRPSHMNISDRLMVLNQGVFVADGPPQKVLTFLEQQREKEAVNSRRAV
jgi:ATP-binding cassette subfamily C protein LapB